MRKSETGGPAFPFAFETEARVSDTATMRDYFAAKALHFVLQDWAESGDLFQDADHAEVVARDCYIMADAMLAERVK